MKPEIFLPKAIRILSNLDLSLNYDQVIQSVFEMVSNVGTMVVTFNPGKPIIRARPMKEGEARFTKIDDFSYRPQDLNIQYQRASTPNRTMFYGATTREFLKPGEIDSGRLIGLSESMPWVRDKNNSGIKKIAYGKWITLEPLELIAVVNHDGFHVVNSFTKEIYDEFIKELNKHDLAYRSAVLGFHEFLAKEFSKEINQHLDYQISANYTDMMCNHSDIDGILYPSFRMEGHGLNIAIKPESMYKLGLFGVGESKIYKNKDQIVVGNCASVVLDGKTFEFDMNEDQNDVEDCLRIIGVRSLDELK